MIATHYLTEWAESHPWKLSEQVEQDLLISRAVVAIYSDPYLAERLAWRGGTAWTPCCVPKSPSIPTPPGSSCKSASSTD